MTMAEPTTLVLTPTPSDDPVAAGLIEAVQQVYVARYGGRDATPVEPAEFAPPRGLFLVGRLGGEPIACGGWPEGTITPETRNWVKRRSVATRSCSPEISVTSAW